MPKYRIEIALKDGTTHNGYPDIEADTPLQAGEPIMIFDPLTSQPVDAEIIEVFEGDDPHISAREV